MSEQRLTFADLDTWNGERKLERIVAPARHAVAAWALIAAIALAAILGPPATRETVAGLIALRSLRGKRATLPAPPATIPALVPDRIERA